MNGMYEEEMESETITAQNSIERYGTHTRTYTHTRARPDINLEQAYTNRTRMDRIHTDEQHKISERIHTYAT